MGAHAAVWRLEPIGNRACSLASATRPWEEQAQSPSRPCTGPGTAVQSPYKIPRLACGLVVEALRQLGPASGRRWPSLALAVFCSASGLDGSAKRPSVLSHASRPLGVPSAPLPLTVPLRVVSSLVIDPEAHIHENGMKPEPGSNSSMTKGPRALLLLPVAERHNPKRECVGISAVVTRTYDRRG